MADRKIIAISMLFALSLAFTVFAGDAGIIYPHDPFYSPSGPQLLYPISDKIILTGKDFLEFRWVNAVVRTDHFVFKIYKGYNMYEKDLIYRQNIPSNASSIKMKSDLFELNQPYSWSLMRVFLDGRKSEKSFSAFKVISK